MPSAGWMLVYLAMAGAMTGLASLLGMGILSLFKKMGFKEKDE